VVIEILLRLELLRLTDLFDIAALARISLYLLLVIVVILFQLTRKFERQENHDIWGWIVGAVILAASALLYENVFHLPETVFLSSDYFLPRWLLAFGILVTGWGFFMVITVVLTLRNYRRNIAPLHRNRNKYWSIAVFLAVAGHGLIIARQTGIGGALTFLSTLAAVYVMLTYNLPDLRLAARRFATYLVMTIITIAAYTGGFFVTAAIFQSAPGYSPLLTGAVLAAALAVLFNPLLVLVSKFVNRLISGVGYDTRQTLSEYSQTISNILDMDVLSTTVISLISEALEITHGALMTVHHQPGVNPGDEVGGVYHLRSTSGLGLQIAEGVFTSRNPAISVLRREHQPLTQYDIDIHPRFRGMNEAERAWLIAQKMDVYLPIYVKETWIGLLALGPKQSGDRYFDEDLALLQTLADQTAVAFENARLYEDLKLRNAENEQLNNELKTANDELARLDHAKSDFINIASHELRTPLTQVIGYNDILGEMIGAGDIQPKVGVQMTESVRKAARRLEEIVETMFDVSKLDTRTLELVRAPVALSGVIAAAVNVWASGMEERKQTITVRGLANLPTIIADNKRLTQVFSHLIQNAIKSTPNGGQIQVTGQLVESGNGGGKPGLDGDRYVEVVIADNGIGIAPEDLERIFEKFYRVGNVLLHSTGDIKFKGAGPGLGLTIARGIVEAHGGRIWAESPGYDEQNCHGATFHVLLPLKAPSLEMPKLK
jgi:signal transduction histidine kinase